jgi:hypothetical protein
MADRKMTCSDCSAEFIFNEREQAFYQTKGFADPKRCKPCRAARKEQKAAAAEYADDNIGQTWVPDANYRNSSKGWQR